MAANRRARIDGLYAYLLDKGDWVSETDVVQEYSYVVGASIRTTEEYLKILVGVKQVDRKRESYRILVKAIPK